MFTERSERLPASPSRPIAIDNARLHEETKAWGEARDWSRSNRGREDLAG